ncbi:MAG: hypothetical protein IJR68_03820 [Fretibacterium sp.]|nr:hypothetical protein [Fretibacterium sp.]
MANELKTLVDLKNQMAPGDGALMDVAEILTQENEILNDIPFVQGNLITGDRYLVRSAMPSAQIRKINEGFESTVSRTEAMTETCIEVVSRSIVDMKELELAPDATKFLLSESRPHIAVMGETFCTYLFYGTDANGILGIAPRYNKLSNEQVIDAGGTGNNLASIYIVKWDNDEVTGIYPKNAAPHAPTAAGIEVKAQADVYVPDRNGKTFRAHVTDYSWTAGFKVRDSRYIARVCNIDRDALLAGGDTAKTARQELFNQIIKAKNKVRNVNQGRVVMYADPDIFSVLEIAAFEKANLALGYGDVEGDRRVLRFSGIPIRRNDCQKNAEKKVN